jgi:hypothetical protein
MGQFAGDKTGAVLGLNSPQLKLIPEPPHSDGYRRHAAFAAHP